jgi:hypothetical protein
MEGREGKGGREEERVRCAAQGRRKVGAEALQEATLRQPPARCNTRSTLKHPDETYANIRLKPDEILKTCV